MKIELDGVAPAQGELEGEEARLRARLKEVKRWNRVATAIGLGGALAVVACAWYEGGLHKVNQTIGLVALAAFVSLFFELLAEMTTTLTMAISASLAAASGAVALVVTLAGGSMTEAAICAAVAGTAVSVWCRRMDSSTQIGENLSDLEPIERWECPSVVAWCESDQVLAGYQRQVAAMSRTLIKAEVDAMRRWHDRAGADTSVDRENAAYERLKTAL